MRAPVQDTSRISTRFGATVRGSEFGKHLGLDYVVPVGTPVLSPVGGVIRSVTSTTAIGKQIELAGDDGWLHRFAHLSAQHVAAKQRVTEGQWLGLSGNTGTASTGPHLHWDVRRAGTAWDASFTNYVNPEQLLQTKEEPMGVISTEAVVAICVAVTGRQPQNADETKFINKPATQANLDAFITYWAAKSRVPELEREVLAGGKQPVALAPGIYKVK